MCPHCTGVKEGGEEGFKGQRQRLELGVSGIGATAGVEIGAVPLDTVDGRARGRT